MLKKEHTTLIIIRIPFLMTSDSRADFECYYSPPERNYKPTTPARKSTDTLTKLKFGDFTPESVVPDNNFVWGIERAGTATNKEEYVRTVHRQDGRKCALRELCP